MWKVVMTSKGYNFVIWEGDLILLSRQSRFSHSDKFWCGLRLTFMGTLVAAILPALSAWFPYFPTYFVLEVRNCKINPALWSREYVHFYIPRTFSEISKSRAKGRDFFLFPKIIGFATATCSKNLVRSYVTVLTQCNGWSLCLTDHMRRVINLVVNLSAVCIML